MWTAYVACGICAALYAATLIRISLKTKMVLLGIMVGLLLVSQISFMLMEHYKYRLIEQIHHEPEKTINKLSIYGNVI